MKNPGIIRNLAISASLLLAMSAVSAPASAGIQLNGVALNGMSLNGIHLNGIAMNGTSAIDERHAVTAITLRDGETLRPAD